MRRLLFVDDEEQILSGLRGLLRHKRKEWEMVFALGPDEALGKLTAERYDAVISDMRMPKMDGAALLAKAKELQPDTVRIVLSGHADMQCSMRALSVAHQYLSKPCDPKVLEETVERAIDLQALIAEQRVRQAVGMLDNLPPLPSTYAELTRALDTEFATAADIAKIVERDMAMSAKLLQIVGSAFFRAGRACTSATQAISYLGFAMVKNLVLLNGLFSEEACPEVPGFSRDELQKHALETAKLASKMVEDRSKKEHAFLAGVVHDIGQLVLATKLPDEFADVLATAKREGKPLHLVEDQRWGVTHAEVGAYLLGIWGLPFPVVEATASHHRPGRVAYREFNLVAVVHAADVLSRGPEHHGELDREYFESIGAADRIDRWIAMAAEDDQS